MFNSDHNSSSGRRSIWHILFEHVPAWITAIVSVVSLVVGFGAGYSTSKAQNPSSAPTAVASEPNPGSSSPAGSSNHGTPSVPTVRREGPLFLNGGTSADLDSNASNWGVPSPPNPTDIIIAQYNTGDAVEPFSGQMFQLHGLSPDYQGCSTTQDYVKSIEFSNLNVGAYFCIQTDEKRWSLIHVTKISQDSISLDVTVWESTENQ